MTPTPEAVADIITSASTALTNLGVLPYVFAGIVIALVGAFIRSAKKAAR